MVKDQMQRILISNEEKIATKAFGGRCGDGLIVKSSCCFCRRFRYDSQHLHSSSQPSAAPVPKDLMPYTDLSRYQAHKSAHTYTHTK